MNGGDGQKEDWLAAMESFSAFICSSTGMTFFLFNFEVSWRTFSVFCCRKNAFLYIHWSDKKSIGGGFNVVMDRGQYGHSDWFAVTQPLIQQAVIHCVYPVDTSTSWPELSFSHADPPPAVLKLPCAVIVLAVQCTFITKHAAHYQNVGEDSQLSITKVNTDWLKFIGRLPPWHLMSSSDLTGCCTPVSCRNLWISQTSCFFSYLPLEPLNRSSVSSPAGIQNISACRQTKSK